MIHLDTNVLIAMTDPANLHSPYAKFVQSIGDVLAVSACAWTEFLSKPVDPTTLKVMRQVLAGGVLPFDEATAALAGELYYRAGSRRRTRMDSMIAATAIRAGAELATTNRDDFAPFVPQGLKLVAEG